ncbi:hypothetical protein E2C01_052494 [Portunus trituberculatus]|uniref:Uncharacterized protein n=1 Tax=Portunus trituberculatus TaxID=210409 RepID=A0A5B7GN63_PORTR|nr:hypothetical protein [Portunus trituberculatus]
MVTLICTDFFHTSSIAVPSSPPSTLSLPTHPLTLALRKEMFNHVLTKSTLSPNLLQKVTGHLDLLPVRSSNMEQLLKGGQYRWRDTAFSLWEGFSTRCSPRESGKREHKEF